MGQAGLLSQRVAAGTRGSAQRPRLCPHLTSPSSWPGAAAPTRGARSYFANFSPQLVPSAARLREMAAPAPAPSRSPQRPAGPLSSPPSLTVPPPPPRPVPPLPSSRSPAPARPAPPGRPQSPPPPAGHVGPGLLGTRRGPSAAIASGRRQRGAGAGPASCGGPGGCQCPAGAAESRAARSNTRVF